jgi:hypothetical protein
VGLQLSLAACGWGSWSGLLQNPARRTACVVVCGLAVAAMFSGFNVSSGKREAARTRWVVVPGALIGLMLAWLPAYCDRRDLVTIDANLVRYWC